jgi:hypothetical protein
MKRSSFTSISIRSPKLLILNNIGNFLMSIILIIPNVFENNINNRKIVSLFYYLTNLLLVVPFCLRFQRIVKCCDIKSDERLDLQELYNKRQLYEENYYIKFTLISFCILTVILIVFDCFNYNDPFTANFLYRDIGNDNIFKIKLIIWQVICFIEHMIILTYVYKIFVNKLKQKLRFEIISFFIIWFIYTNIVSLLDKPGDNIENDELIIIISLGVCYLFLMINAVLPILISFSYKYSTCYHFTPKLMNNLYLFLSNENCYKQFSNYLNGLNENASYHLKLYTQIMNYKLGFKLNIDNNQGFLEACAIRDEHFNNVNPDGKLSKEVFDNVKKECEGLANNHFTDDMFDDALQYSFNELGRYFNDFRKTDSFKELYEEFYLTSYIQCKMCNVGLINKF